MKNIEFNYKVLQDKLENIINHTYSVLKENNYSELIESLKTELLNQSQQKKLKVAFVGQYNAGKSTIISALTNNRDIVIDSNVATDFTTEYDWKNIKIIDTPGILAGKIEQHDEKTINALKEADLIVYVLTSQLFDDLIFENFIDLAYNQQLKDKMIVAINKMSMENGDFDELKKNYSDSIDIIFNERGYQFDFEVIFLDAADYIEGLEEEEEDFIEMSNFDDFISELDKFVNTKGLIKKTYDTPIRLLRSGISNIAFEESDPSFSLLLKKYESRLRKHKIDLERDVDFILDKLKDQILTKGYSISSCIDEMNQEEFDKEEADFNKLIESGSNETLMKIERVISERNNELSQEIDDISVDTDVKLYVESLEGQNNEHHKIHSGYDSSSLNKKLGLIKQAQGLAGKMTEYTGVSKVSGFLAKAKDASGSQAHNVVKSIGNTIGYKFKPWQAVKIAQKAGNIAKFAGPVLSVISVGMEVHGAVKEERELKKVVASKNQMNSSFSEISSEIVSEIRNKFNEFVKENVNSKILDFENQKIEIIKANERSSAFSDQIAKLDAEYVDFIELIN